MNKGAELDKLVVESDEIYEQMEAIFKKHNLPNLALNKLPEEDSLKWHDLYKRSCEVSDQMAKIILNKPSQAVSPVSI